jgi:hypothetical protein
MTENHFKPEGHDHDEDCRAMALTVRLRPLDGDKLERRRVTFGDEPMVLIEIDTKGASGNIMPVSLDATGFSTETLAEYLEMMAAALRSEMVEVPNGDEMSEKLADLVAEALQKPAKGEPGRKP